MLKCCIELRRTTELVESLSCRNIDYIKAALNKFLAAL